MLAKREEDHAGCCGLKRLEGSGWVGIDEAIASNRRHIFLVKEVRDVDLRIQPPQEPVLALEAI
ncbi:hypothetical protein AD936_20415, partial [Gluconobacter japonicus]